MDLKLLVCTWNVGGVCTNRDCYMLEKMCPVPYTDGVCLYEDRKGSASGKEGRP